MPRLESITVSHSILSLTCDRKKAVQKAAFFSHSSLETSSKENFTLIRKKAPQGTWRNHSLCLLLIYFSVNIPCLTLFIIIYNIH